jgi:DNA-binding MarR family transcriptional regulator
MNEKNSAMNQNRLLSIERIFHEPSRMQISALLYVIAEADFTFVMIQLGLTWGNLSAHLTKLEEAGFIEIEKKFKGKRPNTTLRMTDKGREAFKDYALKMRQYFTDLPI